MSGLSVERAWLALLITGTAAGQVTVRVSLGSAGAQGELGSYNPAISADGRYVAFTGYSANLVPGDTNGCSDVFVRDRLLGTTERVSVDSAGTQGNAYSRLPAISPDGRYVAFESGASNLVSEDTHGIQNVFIHDRSLGTTELVSRSSTGAPGNDHSNSPSISADGRFVAFECDDALVPGDTNVYTDVFVRDRQAGTTEWVSVGSAGFPGNGYSIGPSISADGRYVAFTAEADNLVAGDTNEHVDVFVRDRQLGTTELASLNSDEEQGNGDSGAHSISADGRYVAFWSGSANIDPDSDGWSDIYVRDRQAGTTERISVSTAGVSGNGHSEYSDISPDGRFVVFSSRADNLASGDTNGREDVFVRDRQSGTTERVSLDSAGAQGNGDGADASISADGRYVAFFDNATNLVPGDTNGYPDIFVRDRSGGTSFTSLCDPGSGGVIGCPCGNPPSGPGRGCDNSAATGGAVLAASGATFLSSDSLVFTTSGEKPSALSIVMQGNGTIASGVIYGQGVRCLGGTIIRRLFIAHASGGSIRVPDHGAGAPTVSARSAAKGDAIQSGQSRYYLVYYRDPIVLGGCPAPRTFNATQTGRVAWSP